MRLQWCPAWASRCRGGVPDLKVVVRFCGGVPDLKGGGADDVAATNFCRFADGG